MVRSNSSSSSSGNNNNTITRRLTNGASSSSPAARLCSSIASLNLNPNTHQSLIPGLPNDLASLVLACLPLPLHRRLRAVSRSWRAALSSPFITQLRQRLGKSQELLCLFRDDPSLCAGEVFDPRSLQWTTFPPMPCNPSQYSLSNFECLSSGPYLYVMGGSLYDTRSFPMDQPVASNSVFRFDPVKSTWDQLAGMKTPRGSFAAGVSQGFVFVAGGGSRHAQFRAGGDRISQAERYDLARDCWESLPELSSIRAGCAGFFVGGEFWVIGGYGESGTISGILPVDEHYSDGEILDVSTGVWRRLEPMWEDGARLRLGRIAVLNDEDSGVMRVFMLEDGKLLRYDFGSNRWYPETELPTPVSPEFSCRLIAVDGEVYVIPGGVTEQERQQQRQRSRSPARGLNGKGERRRGNILFQIYNPVKQSWRSVLTKPPLDHSINPPWGAMCVIKL